MADTNYANSENEKKGKCKKFGTADYEYAVSSCNYAIYDSGSPYKTPSSNTTYGSLIEKRVQNRGLEHQLEYDHGKDRIWVMPPRAIDVIPYTNGQMPVADIRSGLHNTERNAVGYDKAKHMDYESSLRNFFHHN